MDNSIQQFNFEGKHQIRVVERDGEPWFYASDICAAIDVSNVSDVLSRLENDEKDQIESIDPVGRRTKVWLINEPGLYSVILRSDKPAAKNFKHWVTREVLPSIRKTGSYALARRDPSNLDVIEAMVFQLREQERINAEYDQRLDELEAITHSHEEYYTIVGYYSLKKLGRLSRFEAARTGKMCAALSRERGIEIKELPNSEWGTVNAYHISILAEIVG